MFVTGEEIVKRNSENTLATNFNYHEKKVFFKYYKNLTFFLLTKFVE